MPHTYAHAPGSPDYTAPHHTIRRISKTSWQILSGLPATTHTTYTAAKAHASAIDYPAPSTAAEVQESCAANGLSVCETMAEVAAATLAGARGYELTADSREEEGEEEEEGKEGEGRGEGEALIPPKPEARAWDRLWDWAGWGGKEGMRDVAEGADMVADVLALEPEHRLHIDPVRSVLACWSMRAGGLAAQVWLDTGRELHLLGAWSADLGRWIWAWKAGRMAEEDIDGEALGWVLGAIADHFGRDLDGVALRYG